VVHQALLSKQPIVMNASRHSHNLPVICDDQSIQDLPYKYGESSFGDDNFPKHPDCEKVFNIDELVQNVLFEWFGKMKQILIRS
jgi:hypothetical protein